MKKTRKKQKELLLHAWPNMSPTHRPNFEAFLMENTGRHHMGHSKYQAAFKWPYINQQDLSTKALLYSSQTEASIHPVCLPEQILTLLVSDPMVIGFQNKMSSWDIQCSWMEIALIHMVNWFPGTTTKRCRSSIHAKTIFSRRGLASFRTAGKDLSIPCQMLRAHPA